MKTRYSNSLTEAYRTIVEGENGLWDNIHNKRKRGEKMRKKGDKGAPTDAAIKKSQEETDAEKLHQDSYEIGTDEYRKHTQDVTPGQVEEDDLDEGTWAMPDSSKKLKGLIQVLKRPIPLGKGGDSAVSVIRDFIGDDELYDDLGDAGDKNPKGDARPIIMKAMKRLKITQKNAEFEMDEHKGDKPHKHPHVDETAKQISSRFGKKTAKKEEVELDELKMNDPKLNKVFDKLKPKATVQVKTSSSIAKGKDFKTYLVVSKNTLRNGTEKITLKNRENPTGVKSFLYRRDGSVTFAIGDMGASIDDIKEEVEKAFQSLTLVENYRVLATKGMGAETPKTGKYGQEVDYYEPQHGNKHQGKITKASGFSYTVQDDKTGKKYNFKWYDPKKAKKLMQTESAASDARRAMMKDPDMKQRAFDKDITATDDDEKAASKNIMMQLRKAVSLKGRFAVEFGDGKKIKIPPKIAQEVQRKFNAIRRPQEKQKFQAKVAQSHKSMLAALRESYDTSPQKIVELDEASKEGTVKIIKTKDGKFQIQKMTKGKFVDIGKPHNSAKEAEKFRSGQPDLFGEDDDPCWDNYKQVGMKDKGGKEVPNCVPEEVQLAEGKMKELHGYIQQGKSAEQIAKIMKLDVKTIKSLMASYSVSEGEQQDMVKTRHKDENEKESQDNLRDRMRQKMLDKRKKTEKGRESEKRKKEMDIAQQVDQKTAKSNSDQKKQRDKEIKNLGKTKQRNEVLERVASKLKERKNG